jgi:DNA-binding NarL/FixJ family response regulator
MVGWEDGRLERIQILLVDMPRMVQEMIEQAVAAQPDMHVVATVREPEDLVPAARATRPEFVIFGVPADEEDVFPAACTALLTEQPTTKVLGIAAVAGNAYLYELRPERTPIGAVAPEDIVSAIRKAAAESWAG